MTIGRPNNEREAKIIVQAAGPARDLIDITLNLRDRRRANKPQKNLQKVLLESMLFRG
jgi:hypothetical protein